MNRILVSFAVLATAVCAQATPIQYLFSGTVSGNLDSNFFVAKDFVITLTSNTTQIESFNGFHQTPLAPSTIFIEDIGLLDIDPSERTYSFHNDPTNGVGIGRATSAGDLFDITASGLNGYDMRSAIGPVTGTVSAVNQFFGVATSGGLLTFDQNSISTATYEARLVPEPATIAALALGIGALLRRRRVR